MDFIQLREKDLSVRDLEILAQRAVQIVRTNRSGVNTRLLINSRTDIAIACQADGVHLRGDDISPMEVREIGKKAGVAEIIVSVSCHMQDEVDRAANENATFAVFAPIFEKQGASAVHSVGLAMLADVCRTKIPVLALGGVTVENTAVCMQARAAGVAGIRLFQENDMEKTVLKLRSLT